MATRTILTLGKIADRTDIPIATLRFYRSTGQGPKTFKLGGRVVAFEDDVDAWIMAAYSRADASHTGPSPKRGAA